MKNLSLFVKLGAGFSIILLLVVMLASFVWDTMQIIDEDARILESQFIPVLVGIGNTRARTNAMLLQLRGYNTNYTEEAWQIYVTSMASLKTDMAQLLAHHKRYPHLPAPRMVANDAQPILDTLEKDVNASHLIITQMLVTRKNLRKLNGAVYAQLNEILAIMRPLLKDAITNGDLFQASELIELNDLGNIITDCFNDSRAGTWYGIVVHDFTSVKATEITEVPIIKAKLKELLVLAVNYPKIINLANSIYAMIEQYDKTTTEYLGQLKYVEDTLINQAIVVEKLHDVFRPAASVVLNASGKATQKVLTATENGILTLYIITLICIILAIVIATILVRAITKPMNICLHFAQGVAEGNLDANLDVHQKDEIGKLCDALRVMVTSLKEKIREANAQSEMANKKGDEALVAMQAAEESQAQAEIRRDNMINAAERLEQAVNIISSASTQLSAQIEQSEKGSAEQATRVSETATAMTEMNATVLEVAKSAGDASSISLATKKEAEEGAIVVQKSVASIRAVQIESLKLKEDMSRLDENAKSIGQIMSVISDIADQTNLLALNAAIEAARAGDAGRGFAVVADEVRKLAEKTMSSTADVGKAISGIQSAAVKSVLQMEAAMKYVMEATEYADQSGVALEKIVNMVDSTVDQARSIAIASEEQSATSEEISNSIEQVNLIAVETAQSMKEATAAVVDLSNQARLLTTLVAELKS